MSKGQKYYVIFVEDCTPKIEEFNTKKDAEFFLAEFSRKHGSLDDGDANWVDHMFKGKKLNFMATHKIVDKD